MTIRAPDDDEDDLVADEDGVVSLIATSDADFANEFDAAADEDGQLVLIVTNDADFSPMTFAVSRSGEGRKVQLTMTPITSVDGVRFRFSSQILDSAPHRSTSLTVDDAIGGCLNAQHVAIFPPSENTDPRTGHVRVSQWDRDIALGHIASSLRGLASEGVDGKIPELSDDDARAQTARVVLTSIERLAKTFELRLDAAGERDGMLSFDAALADELEDIGKHGKIRAANVRKNARERFKNRDDLRAYFRAWLPDGFLERAPVGGLPYLRTLGRAAWFDVVQPKIKRRNAKPPALVHPVHVSLVDVLTKTTKTEINGQRSIAFPGVPLVDVAALTAVQARGVELLRSRTAFRFLGWAVSAGHERAIDDVPDARTLHVIGGWSAIAEALGMTSKRAPDDIRAIAEALDIARVPLPTGEQRTLLMLRDAETATGQRQSSIKMILGPELLPDYVFEMRSAMPKGRIRTEAERLVPMLRDVPVTGAKQTYGAQEALAMLFVRELRTHARTLARNGTVEIPRHRWAELGRQARLPDATLPKVLDRWENDGTDAPALLIRKGDGFTLSDAHAPARAFIVDAGRNSADQADRARKGQTSRGQRRSRRKAEPDAG